MKTLLIIFVILLSSCTIRKEEFYLKQGYKKISGFGIITYKSKCGIWINDSLKVCNKQYKEKLNIGDNVKYTYIKTKFQKEFTCFSKIN